MRIPVDITFTFGGNDTLEEFKVYVKALYTENFQLKAQLASKSTQVSQTGYSVEAHAFLKSLEDYSGTYTTISILKAFDAGRASKTRQDDEREPHMLAEPHEIPSFGESTQQDTHGATVETGSVPFGDSAATPDRTEGRIVKAHEDDKP